MSILNLCIESCSSCITLEGIHTPIAERQREFEEKLLDESLSVEDILTSMNMKMCCLTLLQSPQKFYLVDAPSVYSSNKDTIIAPCEIPKVLPVPLSFPDV